MIKKIELNKDIEEIYNNYSYWNLSDGDIERTKAVVNKYVQIEDGFDILTGKIREYIRNNEKLILQAQGRIATMEKFLRESNYEQLFNIDKRFDS